MNSFDVVVVNVVVVPLTLIVVVIVVDHYDKVSDVEEDVVIVVL